MKAAHSISCCRNVVFKRERRKKGNRHLIKGKLTFRHANFLVHALLLPARLSYVVDSPYLKGCSTIALVEREVASVFVSFPLKLVPCFLDFHIHLMFCLCSVQKWGISGMGSHKLSGLDGSA